MPINNKTCAVVVSSCDAFQDLWPAFFKLFFKYWPDCPYPIYLVNNHLHFEDERVHVLSIGQDKKWASNLKTALKEISAGYILYMQEDYLFRSKVNTALVERLVEHASRQNVAYLRLFASPKPDEAYSGIPNLGLLSTKAGYRTSLQAAIWDKNYLDSLLIDGESGWDMEFEGTERSRTSNRLFLSVKKTALDYFPRTAIKKGRWYYDAVKLCEREGIALDLTKRPVESFSQYLWRRISHLPFVGKGLRYLFRTLS